MRYFEELLIWAHQIIVRLILKIATLKFSFSHAIGFLYDTVYLIYPSLSPRWEGPGVRKVRDRYPHAHQGRGDGRLQGQEELQGEEHGDDLLYDDLMFSFQANAYKDTLPNDVTNITYEPKLATFEMDIMQVKHTYL